MRIILCVLLLASCAQKEIKPALQRTDFLFPDAVYNQDVDVHYVKDGKAEAHSFKAILKKTPTEITMLSYVGFGITLFKIKDDLKGNIEFTTTDPRIEKNKEFFLKIYPAIKEILSLKRIDIRLQQKPFILDKKENIEFVTEKYNSEGVPEVFRFEKKPYFSFKITTREIHKL